MINISREKPEHIEAISKINREVFSSNAEANLVDKLRDTISDFYSFVAIIEGKIIGHILFTPVTLDNNPNNISIFGLAPMAVMPEYQRKGVGSKLIERGLKVLKSNGVDVVVVLGHKEYYPKFGFEPSANYGVTSEFDVPEDVFMIKILNGDCTESLGGTIKYHELFSEV